MRKRVLSVLSLLLMGTMFLSGACGAIVGGQSTSDKDSQSTGQSGVSDSDSDSGDSSSVTEPSVEPSEYAGVYYCYEPHWEAYDYTRFLELGEDGSLKFVFDARYEDADSGIYLGLYSGSYEIVSSTEGLIFDGEIIRQSERESLTGAVYGNCIVFQAGLFIKLSDDDPNISEEYAGTYYLYGGEWCDGYYIRLTSDGILEMWAGEERQFLKYWVNAGILYIYQDRWIESQAIGTISDGVISIQEGEWTLYYSLEGVEPEADTEYRIRDGGIYVHTEDGYVLTAWLNADAEVLEIPAEIDGVVVTGINSIGNLRITEAVIPETVKYIAEQAFDSCISLKTITVATDNPNYSSADGILYDKAQTTLIRAPYGVSGEVVLPDSVMKIASGAFADCVGVNKITLPAGLQAIESGAFDGCVGLSEIYNRSSLDIERYSYTYGGVASHARNIYTDEEGAALTADENGFVFAFVPKSDEFSQDEYLLVRYEGTETDIVLPESYNGVNYRIADGAFAYNDKLTSVTLGNGVESVGEYAFLGCNNLQSISIGANVSSVWSGAFGFCGNLTDISVDEENTSYYSEGNCLIETSSGTLLFGSASGIVPDGVKIIGDEAFAFYETLERVILPESVEEIGDSAFFGCENLTFVVIPAGIRSVRQNSFSWCNSLQAVYYTGEEWDVGDLNMPVYSANEWEYIDGIPALHTYGEWTVIKDATCSETGLRSRVCMTCGYEQTEETEMLPHDYEIRITTEATHMDNGAFSLVCRGCGDAVKGILYATGHTGEWIVLDSGDCMTDGKRTQHCPVCQKDIEEVVPARGYHSYERPEIIKEPTCTEEGEQVSVCYVCGHEEHESIPATGHELIDGSGNERIYYAVTGTEIGNSGRENVYDFDSYVFFESGVGLGAWYIVSDGEVKNFGVAVYDGSRVDFYRVENNELNKYYSFSFDYRDETIYIDGQEYDCNGEVGWSVTALTDCTQTRTLSNICRTCGLEILRTLPASGHSYIWTTEKDASCSETGLRTGECVVCGHVEEEIIPTETHTYGSWRERVAPGCETAGERVRVCGVCGAEDTEAVEPLGHDYSAEWTTDIEPTCEEAGSKSRHCSRCEAKTDITEIPANGHNWSEWEIKKAATCTESGLQERECSVCHIVEEETVWALGHDYSSEWTIDEEPTCEGVGSKSRHCSRCDAKTDITEVPANGHSWDEWVITEKATCTGEGNRKRECSACNESQEEIIPALGHEYSEKWIIDKEATETSVGERSRYCVRCGDRTDITEIPCLPYTDGLTYALNASGDGYIVTGIGIADVTELNITPVYNGLPVVEIGERAFYNCINLTSIEFPDSISVIGDSAFLGCDKLIHVYIGDIGAWCSIAFENETANPLYYAESLWTDGEQIDELVIPAGVTSIGKYAFSNYIKLKSVTFPDSFYNVGSNAFYGCTGLTAVYTGSVAAWCSIRFENRYSNPSYYAGVIYIDGKAVSELVIPEGVGIIGDYAFVNNRSLISVKIAKDITYIGVNAFYDCSNLKNVYIEDIAAWCTIQFDDNPLEYASNLYVDNELIEKLVIPEGVTSIVGGAFQNCANLVEVEISSGVTSIGSSAFINCINLTDVKISDSVTDIGSSAFSGCTSLVRVNIPSGLESIEGSIFKNCSSLSEIDLPNGITSIGASAFSGCSSLSSIVIPEGVTTIGGSVFSGCSSLSSIVIPEGVTIIGGSAFSGCSSLSSIVIPEGVTTIGGSAFSKCSSLTSIEMPKSLSRVMNSAFSGCTNLKEVHIKDLASWCEIDFSSSSNPLYYGGDLYINGTLIENLTIPEEITGIGNNAFVGCGSLKSVVFSDGVERINTGVFRNCVNLTKVEFSESISYIGGFAFYGCTGLTNIAIPDSVTSIGGSAFYGCTGLTNIVISNSVTSIGSSAFSDCTGLTNIVIPDSVTSIGSSAFSDCTGLTNIVIPDSVTSIGSSAFSGCTGLTSVTIGSGVSRIVNNAFRGCSALTSLVVADDNTVYHSENNCLIETASKVLILGCKNSRIPSDGSVTSIGISAFSGSGLTSIEIPNSIISIGESAFSGCSELTNIIISENVTEIDAGVFRDCSSLTSITIPNGVISIGNNVFYGCSSLVSIVIPDGVTSIGNNAFQSCSNLVSITIPDSVKNIGNGAFSLCSGLISISVDEGNTVYHSTDNCLIETETKILVLGCRNSQIPSDGSVTVIAEEAFFGCNALTSIEIPNSVTSIEGGAFASCDELTTIVIPDSVTSIGYNAFSGCKKLTSVIIGDNVTNIGSSAFSGCSSLSSIEIPDSVMSVGNWAFENCYALMSVYYGGTEEEWLRITIGNNNSCLTDAMVYYYSESEPALNADGTGYDGNYWHYDADGVTPVVWKKES